MLTTLRKIIEILGKKWWFFLFLILTMDACFCFGSACLDRDETTFVSSVVHRYQTQTGNDHILFESFSNAGEQTGYYRYSDAPMAFEHAAANSEYRTKEKHNTYFYLSTSKNGSFSTIIKTNEGQIGCNVFVPATEDSHGSTFSFEQFGNSPITFENSLTDTAETFVSENIASSLLGEKITDQNYQEIIGFAFETSLDSGVSFSTTKKISGVIKKSSLGIYNSLLGDNFLYSPFSTASKHFQDLHMELMLRDDWVENETVLRSIVFSNNPTREQGEHRIYDIGKEGDYVLGELNKKMIDFERFPSSSIVFSRVLAVIFLLFGLCLLALVLLIERKGGESNFPLHEKRGRDIFNAMLFVHTIIFLIVFSAGSLIRFSLPVPSFFVLFGPLSMIINFLFFFAQTLGIGIIFHYFRKQGWCEGSIYFDSDKSSIVNKSATFLIIRTEVIKL